jgi:hypothetical protein
MTESQSENESQHETESQSLIQNSNDVIPPAIAPLHRHLINLQNQVVAQHSEQDE